METSEQVIVEAPFSFTGATKRLWRLNDNSIDNEYLRVAVMIGVMALVVLAWIWILMWYTVFGIFLIPYRVIRRDQRQRHKSDLRHRELLEQGDQS